ncbi:hypothetical protein VAA_02024 [Vibrio anguillarum 775]|nr:hypothetical protein VAA_02024 [Vibrio anguillarum 775]
MNFLTIDVYPLLPVASIVVKGWAIKGDAAQVSL